jgi:hypothetical protein
VSEAVFFGALALVVIGSAAWLLQDFGERWRERPQAWPRRLAAGERIPAWMRRGVASTRALNLPPMLGPARLPSLARHEPAAPDERRPLRRTERPRRSRPTTLRPAV